MYWCEKFHEDLMPSWEDIREFIGAGKTLWDQLTAFIEEAYQVNSQLSYSKCSAQPGWNVKYKKSSKALCTLYPMDGYFIALVVVGAKEEEEVKIGTEIGEFTPYVKELYQNTPYSAMGRWLMIEVKETDVLEDVKYLLGVRVKIKQKNPK